MNTPIISPWFFYFAGIADVLRVTLLFSGCILLMIATAALLGSISEENEVWKKYSIRGVIIGIVITILGLFCPSEKTCYTIALAKYATPQNIKAVTEYVDDTTSNVADNVSDAIKDIMDYSVDRIYDIRNNQRVDKGAE